MKYLLMAMFLMACNPPCPYDRNNYQSITDYSLDTNITTPKGINVDPGKQSIDLLDIDRRTDEVETCLQKLFPNGVLPNDIKQSGSCLYSTFDTTIHRDCINVKFPDNWYHSCRDPNWQLCDTPGCGEQVFPCDADPKLCEAKGFIITPECPCACRAIIQDNHTIITAPNMHLYKAELIRMITGCNNIWTTSLASCYTAE